jgi:hypothetical protein
MVKDVTYFANDQWVSNTYNSCKDIQVPALGGTILVFLCGPWGENNCTPHRMFDFLGDFSNGYTPFKINYEYLVEDGHGPPTVACQATAPGYDKACPCQDCPAACGCATELLFQTDGSFPAGSFLCTDTRGGAVKLGGSVPVGTTCLFLEEGHAGRGHFIEFHCADGGRPGASRPDSSREQGSGIQLVIYKRVTGHDFMLRQHLRTQQALQYTWLHLGPIRTLEGRARAAKTL